jgi:DNA-binding PadR family transcriptional regulator
MRHVTDRNNLKPLSEPVLLILTSLADEPRHGYALIKDIESLSEGRVRLSTGTLYGAIRRLVDDGLIEPFDQQDTSRDKQAYRLTSEGRQQLRMELERMKQLMQKAAVRLRAKRI